MSRLLATYLLCWLALAGCGSATTDCRADWGLECFGRDFLPDCIGRWCCDDYCPKPVPCPQPVKCFRCDDYCAKPLPCAVPVRCFSCDNYCGKCLPPVCGPPRCDLVCPPSGNPFPACRTSTTVDSSCDAASFAIGAPEEILDQTQTAKSVDSDLR